MSLTNLEEELFDLGIRMSKYIRTQSTLDEPRDILEEEDISIDTETDDIEEEGTYGLEELLEEGDIQNEVLSNLL